MTGKSKTLNNKILWTLSFVFVALFFIWAHRFTTEHLSDDAWFSVMLDGSSLYKYLHFRYFNWTSRLLIETLEVTLTRVNFLVWQALDVIMILLLIWGICELTDAKYALAPLWSASLLCFIPAGILYQAGWVSTSVNYIWTSAAAVISLLPLKGKGNRWISLLFLIFACNQEQILVILLAIFLIWFISERKVKIPETIVIATSLIWTLTCPGNAARTAASLSGDYPGYEYLSIFDKLKVGILDCISYFPAGGANQIILIVFTCSVALVIFYKIFAKENLNQIYGLLSVASVLILIFTGFPIRHIVAGGELIKDPYMYDLFSNKYLSSHEYCLYEEKNVTLEILAFIILFIVILFLLFKAGDSIKESIWLSFIFLIAIGSKVMLGFTPSVYASGFRPAFPGSVMILGLSFYLLNKLPEKVRNICGGIALILAVFMFRYIVPGETF